MNNQFTFHIVCAEEVKKISFLFHRMTQEKDFLYVDMDDKKFKDVFWNSSSNVVKVCLTNNENNCFAQGCFDKYLQKAFISMVMVEKEYRRQGLGRELLAALEKELALIGSTSDLVIDFFNPCVLEWWIDKKRKCNHPNAPGVLMGSGAHQFFTKIGYQEEKIQNGYLKVFEETIENDCQKVFGETIENDCQKVCGETIENDCQKVCGETIENDCQKVFGETIQNDCSKILKEENGFITSKQLQEIEIVRFNAKIHTGFEELIESFGNPVWMKEILGELCSANPREFIIACDQGKVVGFAGPLDVEPSKRGFFMGIGVKESYHGKGIAKALFIELCQSLDTMGAKYMSLFTGEENPARKIYENAGFQKKYRFINFRKRIERGTNNGFEWDRCTRTI